MTQTTISISRALVELKTLDSRITKSITNNTWILLKTKNKNYGFIEEEFNKNTKADFQSLEDLIERRNKIKNAIMLSNSITMVDIGTNKVSVAQAIEYKKTIQYKTELLNIMKKQKQNITVEFENHKHKVQNKIDENIKIICGRDSKPDETTLKTVSIGIEKSDPVEIYDPLKLDNIIKDYEKDIEDFTANIDYVLSESNALTKIFI